MVESRLQGQIFSKYYKMQKKLGQGSFGDIYIGQHKDTGVSLFI